MFTDFTEEDRYSYDLTPNSVVIDAGAYKGEFSARIAQQYRCRVIGFEPIHRYYLQAGVRVALFKNARIYHLGVSGAIGERVDMEVREDESGRFRSSRAPQGVESCKLCPIEPALDLLGVGHVDLLKLNIEGSEFELLEHITAFNLQSRFENIQVQWHDVVCGGPQRRDLIIERLNITHEVTYQMEVGWVWQNFRRRG